MAGTGVAKVVITADDQTQAAFSQVNAKLIEMKAQSAATMQTMRDETEKARASVALLGEDIGVKIPRHLQTLIAESGLAAGALNAAFGGIALIAFLDVLGKVKDKVIEVANEMAGWGKAEQAAYAKAVTDNQKQIDYLNQIKNLQRAIALDKTADPAAKAALQAQFAAEDLGNTKTLLAAKTEEWKNATAKVTQLQQEQNQALSQPSGSDEGAGIIGVMEYYDQAIKKATEDAKALGDQVEMLQRQSGVGGLTSQKDNTEAANAATEKANQLQQQYLTGLRQIQNMDAAIQQENDDGWKKIVDRYQQRIQQVKDIADRTPALAAEAAAEVERIEAAEAQAISKYWDQANAAMMKALTPDPKQLAGVLGIASGTPLGPLDGMDKLSQQIIASLKAETAQEKALTDQGKEYGESQFGIEQKLSPLRTQTVKDLKDTVEQYKQMAILAKDPTMIENAKKFEAELDALKTKAQSVGQVIGTDFRVQGLQALDSIATGTKSVTQAFHDMALAIIQDIEKMIVEWLFFKAISGIMGAFGAPAAGSLSGAAASSGSSGLTGAFSSGIVPHFASGGSFGAGMPMIVGENGPELMVPSSAGSIIPNSKLGGNTYNIDARGSQPGVEQSIMKAIKASEDRAVVRSVRSIDSRAKRRG